MGPVYGGCISAGHWCSRLGRGGVVRRGVAVQFFVCGARVGASQLRSGNGLRRRPGRAWSTGSERAALAAPLPYRQPFSPAMALVALPARLAGSACAAPGMRARAATAVAAFAMAMRAGASRWLECAALRSCIRFAFGADSWCASGAPGVVLHRSPVRDMRSVVRQRRDPSKWISTCQFFAR